MPEIEDALESMTIHLIQKELGPGGSFERVLSEYGDVVINGRTKRSISFTVIDAVNERKNFIIKIKEN